MGTNLSNARKIAALLPVSVALMAAPTRVQASFGEDVQLRIDTEKIAPKDAPHIDRLVRARMAKQLRDGGIEVSDTSADRIEIRFDYIDERDLEYSIHVDIFRDAKPSSTTIEWFTCVGCNYSMVVDAVAGKTSVIVDILTQQDSAPAPASVLPPPPAAATHDSAPRSITALGITGTVTLVGAIGLTAWGAPLLQKTEETPDDGNSKSIEGTDYRRRGRVMVGLGGAFMVAGIVALAVDLGVQRRRRKTFFAGKKHVIIEPRPLGVALHF